MHYKKMKVKNILIINNGLKAIVNILKMFFNFLIYIFILQFMYVMK